MYMNRRLLLAAALLSLYSSSWGQGVGLWAPGAVLGPSAGTSVQSSTNTVRPYSDVRRGIYSAGQTGNLPYTVLTPTGRYLITTDPATGYVSSIIEVSRTRD